MKAVILKSAFEVAVEERPEPEITRPTDAIVKMTSSAICGSDLHMYDGRTVAEPGTVLGHEPLGVVAEVGAAVSAVKPGDRVVMPFNVSCGACYNCVRGETAACLTVNPTSHGGAYGYAGMGPFHGGQAEYLLVPFADANCLRLPGEPGDAWEDDFVLLADVFPTGYFATDLAAVEPSKTVGVFGAGPVGLMAAYAAILRGATEVYVVDYIPERLEKARELGATPIDLARGDPVEQIYEHRRRFAPKSVEPGAERMPGVMCGIEAVGYQALDWEHSFGEKSNRVLEDLIRLINPTGHLGIVGLFVREDPGGQSAQAQRGELQLSFGKLWEKGISFGTGQTPVKRYGAFLRDLISAGRARPSAIVSHRVPLAEAAEAYDAFRHRKEGVIKVILKP